MTDSENKLSAVRVMQDMAATFADLDDKCRAKQLLITARGWDTTGAPSNEELLVLGIDQADVIAFVGFMSIFNTLMSGTNRAIIDGMRSL